MSQSVFLVDVENTGRTPFSGVMTEFGVVEFASRATFHGVLYDSMPSAQNATIPVLAPGDGPRYQRSVDPKPVLLTPGTRPIEQTDRTAVFTALVEWMDSFDGDRAIFFSDNNGHDFMFMAYSMDEAGVENPFGHSSRRIGDLAAGLAGKCRQTSAWKRWRKTKHTHNPVDDSMGNAEALATLLAKYDQVL